MSASIYPYNMYVSIPVGLPTRAHVVTYSVNMTVQLLGDGTHLSCLQANVCGNMSEKKGNVWIGKTFGRVQTSIF